MKLDSSIRLGLEDGEMSANILLIEYEPRYVERVQEALKASDSRLEIAADVDAAVERCAEFEPQVVIMTSVLPQTKIEDAITQLRARAGLRSTPFLILMSGYRGVDSQADAERYGAQDILERPFSSEQLTGKIDSLLEGAADPAATQAIPKDMLQSLQHGAEDGGGPSLTSDDLFGDILSDVEGEGKPKAKPSKPPAERPPAADDVTSEEQAKTRAVPVVGKEKSAGPNVLDDVIREGRSSPPIQRKAPPSETDVDMILSQTLAGLDIHPVRTKAAPKPPAPEKAAEDKAPEPSAPKSVGDEAVPPPERKKQEPPKAAPPPDKAKKTAEKAAPPAAVSQDRPAPAEADSADGSQFGQYVLVEHIATGGMAEVHKARMIGMEGFQKIVAIKRILPHLTDNEEFVTMFIDEAKLAAQLNHNNIIHIYDLGKIDRSYYIAMEYIEGQDLRSLLRECRERDVRLPVPLAIHITTLLASALEYAHRKRDFENRDLGLVHRDVSPQNVLISNDGDIKLCDFGIAKAASKASHTRAGALKGKLQYMSPEQAWGKSIDHRSDIFSLGSVLYEMLTGQKLFAGDSELSILEQVRNPTVKPPSEANPEVSKYVNRIVMRALEANPDKRYQSAREMRRDLEKLARRHGWSVDSVVLARFMEELVADKPITSLDQLKAKGKPEAKGKEKEAEKPAAGGPPTKAAAVEASPQKKEPSKKPAAAPAPTPSEPVKPAEKPEAEAVVVAAVDGDEQAEKSGSMKWILIGVAAVVVIGVGLTLMLGGGEDQDGASAVDASQVAVTPSPTPSPESGLLTEEEMIAQAAQVAEEMVNEKTDEIQARLEQEFPTPTPIPPTPTPEPTPEPTPTQEEVAVAQPTPTPVPPTPTPMPPTPTPTPRPPTPTPTPSVREGDIIEAGTPGLVLPSVINQVTPDFPRMAERLRAQGTVTLEILIGTNGAVEQIRNVNCTRTGVGFEKAAEDAVRQWRYKPATKNGVKVKVWIPVRMPFTFN